MPFMIRKILRKVKAKIKREVQLLVNRGNQYHCPFCLYRGRSLLPFGYDIPVLFEKQIIGGGRRPSLCHNCKSSDRERLIYLYLTKKMCLPTGAEKMKVLHIAPEQRITQKLLQMNFKKYICGDLFAEGYDYPIHVQNMNLLNLPLKEDTFDLIICNHVLEHIEDDRSAMRELYRVLKKGGKAILQVPISNILQITLEDFSIQKPQDRERVFGQFDHVRIYGQDYPKRLEECGFKINRINISAEFPKYGLNPQEDLFIVEK
jgi:SAM-dependent methyltransferase